MRFRREIRENRGTTHSLQEAERKFRSLLEGIFPKIESSDAKAVTRNEHAPVSKSQVWTFE